MGMKLRSGRTVMGLLLFVGSLAGMTANEWVAAREQSIMSGLLARVVEISPVNPTPGAEGKPVHVQGDVRPTVPLVDPGFGISMLALKLERQVQMYQWFEREEGSGDERSYRYGKRWASHLIPSAKFRHRRGHENPTEMAIKPQIQIAADAKISRVTFDPAVLAGLVVETFIDAAGEKRIGGRRLVADEGWWLSGDPARPEIGDLRVRIGYVEPQLLSAVGVREAAMLVPVTRGDGRKQSFVALGAVDPGSMISEAKHSHYKMVWGYRIAAWMAMVGGLLLMRPWIVRRLPVLGKTLGGLDRITAALIAACFWCLGLALAWIVFRPLWSLILVAAAVLLIGLLLWLTRRRAARVEH